MRLAKIGMASIAMVAIWVVSACDRAAEPQSFSLSDSAGVWIAESPLPSWEEDDVWVVADTPSVVIGESDGPEEYLLSNVVTAWRLPDGRIVVGDRMASEGMVRFYDSTGAFLNHVGRAGSGPGEIRILLSLMPYRNDSIMAWDPAQARLSVFDLNGRLGRTQSVSIPTDEPPVTGPGPAAVEMGGVVGTFRDGTLLVSPNRVTQQGGEATPWRPRYVRQTAEGEPLSTIDPAPGFEPSVRAGQPFLPRPVRVTHEEYLYSGTGELYEIRVHDLEGRLEGIIRAFHRDLRVSDEAREAYLETRRERAEGGVPTPELERELRDVDFPDMFPAYSGILVDQEAHLWVAQYHHPGEDGDNHWDVFDPDGRLLGTVEIPQGLRVEQIGTDFILGVYADEFGVPQVRVYGLSRM